LPERLDLTGAGSSLGHEMTAIAHLPDGSSPPRILSSGFQTTDEMCRATVLGTARLSASNHFGGASPPTSPISVKGAQKMGWV
jgi:hypothetical protein